MVNSSTVRFPASRTTAAFRDSTYWSSTVIDLIPKAGVTQGGLANWARSQKASESVAESNVISVQIPVIPDQFGGLRY